MDIVDKLRILGGAAKYDVCAATGCNTNNGSAFSSGVRNVVCHSFLPDGRCVSLFRVLMTNECQKDCFYCPNRCQQDVPRTSFKPEELAKLFIEFYRRNYVEGLFLSSGVSCRPSATMADMLTTVELLRFKYHYKGYIHLKVLPGAGYDYVERATQLVTRLSINIEAPNQDRLNRLSKTKNLKKDILTRMEWVNKLASNKKVPAGQTTQFIVGAAGESDFEILGTARTLYDRLGLRRAYFSAFQPAVGTPLENVSSTPLLREHRLYQADILMRQFGFSFKELSFGQQGNLSLKIDPKLAVALKNVDKYPLEINKASYSQLLRVPGIGHTSAKRIVKARKDFRLTNINELKNTGAIAKRALPFLTINGRSFETYKYVEQLAFWGDESETILQNESPLFNKSGINAAAL